MNTFLFAWNPQRWIWENLEESLEELNNIGTTNQMWSCKSHKKVTIGDCAFLIKLGGKDNGIIGAGYINSDSFSAKHWDGSEKFTQRVMIEFEDLVGRNEKPIISIDILKSEFPNQVWSTQASGIIIKSDIALELERKWLKSLNNNTIKEKTSTSPILKEGNPYKLTITKYERNQFARNECLNHYGYLCQICKIDFEKVYGQIGKNFIHVHHITTIASIGKTYEINPIKDLIPLCPNCHSMIHRRNPPFSIKELIDIYCKK